MTLALHRAASIWKQRGGFVALWPARRSCSNKNTPHLTHLHGSNKDWRVNGQTERSICSKLQFIPADACFSGTPAAPLSQAYGLLTFSQIQMEVPEKNLVFARMYHQKIRIHVRIWPLSTLGLFVTLLFCDWKGTIVCAESSAVQPTAPDKSGRIFAQKQELFFQLCTQPQTLVIDPWSPGSLF